MEKEFRAPGAMHSIGWVVLYYDKMTNNLFNVWVKLWNNLAKKNSTTRKIKD